MAQGFSVEPLFFLPVETRESSGLIYLNDKILTHNDSGNDARLFEIDVENGSLVRDLVVENATNRDWEDLAYDQQYIYVADIGNNTGNRLDLKIYRIPLVDYFVRTDGSLSADSISFKYQDQISFQPTQLTNFDSGALMVYEDSLYIFTKNWADQHTNIYSIPKVPGDYEAKRVGRINTQGLVTGAVYNQAVNEIMLVGYNLNNAFLVRLYDFEPYRFDLGKSDKLAFEISGSYQAEAIAVIDESEYFITTEGNDLGDGLLLRLVTDFVVGLNDFPQEELVIYPNPSTGSIAIKGNKHPLESISIYNKLGANVYSYTINNAFGNNPVQLDVSQLTDGLYQLKINSGNTEMIQKLVIQAY